MKSTDIWPSHISLFWQLELFWVSIGRYNGSVRGWVAWVGPLKENRSALVFLSGFTRKCSCYGDGGRLLLLNFQWLQMPLLDLHYLQHLLLGRFLVQLPGCSVCSMRRIQTGQEILRLAWKKPVCKEDWGPSWPGLSRTSRERGKSLQTLKQRSRRCNGPHTVCGLMLWGFPQSLAHRLPQPLAVILPFLKWFFFLQKLPLAGHRGKCHWSQQSRSTMPSLAI